MGENENAAGMFQGIRGIINDIRLLLVDMLGLGKPDTDEQMLIEVFFGLMGYLAKADRLVSSHESNLADTVMNELDLSMAGRELAMAAFSRGMHRNVNVVAELLRFTDVHGAGSEKAEHLYDVLLRLAAADSRLDPREHETMQQVTKCLGMPASTLENKLAQFNIRR